MLYIKGEKLEPKQRRAVLKDRRLQHIKPEQINDYAFLIMKSGRLMPPQAKQTIKLPPAIPVAERRAGNQKIDQLMGCTKRRFNTKLKAERLSTNTEKMHQNKARKEANERKQLLAIRFKPSYAAIEAQQPFKPEVTLIKKMDNETRPK